MIFSQREFFVFFAIILMMLVAVRENRARKVLLLLASYYFYSWWDYRFLGLIIGSTLVDYIVAGRIFNSNSSTFRRLLLIVSLVINLGLLAVFKYFNFFVESFNSMMMEFGLKVPRADIVLPVGISFYTFQTLSYTIDVYRGSLRPSKSLLDFAVFVGFFPQLVAGPIVRAADFLPQLARPICPLQPSATFSGFSQFTIGLFKKVYIADNLAAFVDPVFQSPLVWDGITVWLAVICYAIQIYCDFSGYSDMAIGIARILGFQLGENFRHPYVATSIAEFWGRWHISLSTWLRDYLYISLGGNRRGLARTLRNLLITMLLGGLWHGASWTFVVWGLLHGSALCVARLWTHSGTAALLRIPRPIAAATGWISTMLVVLIGWVFFRSASFEIAANVLHRMLVDGNGVAWRAPFPCAVILCFPLVHLLRDEFSKNQWLDLQRPSLWSWTAISVMMWLVIIFHPTGFAPFIYFQF